MNVEAQRAVEALTRSTVPIDRIKIDEDFYPRWHEDSMVIAQYAESMRAGANFPAVHVDQNYRLIDGLHRYRAHQLNGQKNIEVIREKVKDDVDFFKRAMTANAHHGRRYTSIDYAHMVLRGRALGLKDEQIADLVYVTPGFLEEATRDWFALNSKREQVPLKRTIRHMRGRKLTSDQLEANRKLSGMNQTFYVNQVLLLLENDLVDTDNPKLIEKLGVLQESVGNFLMGLAKRGR